MDPLRPMDPAEVYKQQYAHLGRLNETLYKMPTVFAAIIGGLWFFAAGYLEKDRLIAGVVFAFSAAVSAASAVAVHKPTDAGHDTSGSGWLGFRWELVGSEIDACRDKMKRWIARFGPAFDPERPATGYPAGAIRRDLEPGLPPWEWRVF